MGQPDREPFKGFLGFRPKFYAEADDPMRQSDREPFKGFLADGDGASRFMSALKQRPFFKDELEWYEAEIAEVRRRKAILERDMEELVRDRAQLPHLALELKAALTKLRKRPGRPSLLEPDLLYLDRQLAAHPGESARAWFLAAVENGVWSKPVGLRQAKDRYNAAFDEGAERFGWEFRLK